MLGSRKIRIASFIFFVSLILVGCTPTVKDRPSATASVSPTPTPSKSVAPILKPESSAAVNLLVFENALTAAGAGKAGHSVADSISALVQAGFPIGAITYTSETSKIGGPSDSVSLAVEFNGECLIGQFSQSWLATIVAPITDSGCLIGDVQKP